MSHTSKITFWIIPVGLFLLFVTGCRQETVMTPAAAVPTPSPTIDRAQLAPDSQQNAFKQYAPGLLARTIYKAEKVSDLNIEVWELLVGPGKKSEAAKLPGAAVAEVRSGTGVVTIGEKRSDLKSGSSFSVDDGETFQLENTSKDDGLSLRLVLIQGQ